MQPNTGNLYLLDFAWISLPNQKERAEELANMTKNKEKDREIVRKIIKNS